MACTVQMLNRKLTVQEIKCYQIPSRIKTDAIKRLRRTSGPYSLARFTTTTSADVLSITDIANYEINLIQAAEPKLAEKAFAEKHFIELGIKGKGLTSQETFTAFHEEEDFCVPPGNSRFLQIPFPDAAYKPSESERLISFGSPDWCMEVALKESMPEYLRDIMLRQWITDHDGLRETEPLLRTFSVAQFVALSSLDVDFKLLTSHFIRTNSRTESARIIAGRNFNLVANLSDVEQITIEPNNLGVKLAFMDGTEWFMANIGNNPVLFSRKDWDHFILAHKRGSCSRVSSLSGRRTSDAFYGDKWQCPRNPR